MKKQTKQPTANHRVSLRFYQQPRFRYGTLSTVLLCITLAVLILVCMVADRLEEKYGWRGDYSFNAVTTQSEQTLDILATLEHPVHIYALFARGQEDGPLLELLGRYAAASDMVTWEQVDISMNPGLIAKFTTDTGDAPTNDSLIVYCEETKRFRILSWAEFASMSYNELTGTYELTGLAYESKITTAIAYVSRNEIPRALFLQGHGELDENATVLLAELLYQNNYDVAYFTLDSSQVTLTSGDLLLVLSPVVDFTDDEMVVLQDFITAGGCIFFTCDYTDPVLERMPNYLSLLRSYGFVPLEGVVVASSEEKGTYYGGNRLYLRPTMQLTEITMDLVADNTTTLILPASRAFEVPQESDNDLVVETVLLSGNKAYLHDYTTGATTLDYREGDRTGPFALALQAARTTATGDISRAFALGCSTLLTSSDLYAMTVSESFLIRAAEYLLDTEPVDLGIVAKVALRPQLAVDSLAPGCLLLVALPAAVACAAVLVLWPRRSR